MARLAREGSKANGMEDDGRTFSLNATISICAHSRTTERKKRSERSETAIVLSLTLSVRTLTNLISQLD